MPQYRRIYFDMDGVLADFNKAATRVEKITGFDRHSDGFWSIVSDSAETFYAKMAPIDEIKNLAVSFAQAGYNLNVLSKVPYSCKNGAMIGKTIFLDKWYKDIFRDVIFVPTENEKAHYCQTGDILIDDQTKNLEPWVRVGGVPILYDAGRMVDRLDTMITNMNGYKYSYIWDKECTKRWMWI